MNNSDFDFYFGELNTCIFFMQGIRAKSALSLD